MSSSVAERTSGRTVVRRDPTRPGLHIVPGDRHGRQLSLLGVPEAGDTEAQPLDLAEHIAALERELRYYRRLVPALARVSAKPSRPEREHGLEREQALACEHGASREHTPTRDHHPQLDSLARWLTDGTRLIGSLSQTAAEQRQLELRLEAVERAHQQLRDEVTQLFADDPEEHGPVAAMLAGGWLRAGLVALIVVMVAIVSFPFLMDWWQAAIPRNG